jgi:5'-3' exonuclease
MGIHKLLPNLPGGNIVTDTKYGLQKLNVEECAVALDAGTLLFECAQRRPTSYLNKDYIPSLQLFRDTLLYLRCILDWKKLFIVLDGGEPSTKEFEHARRQEKRDQAAEKNDAFSQIRNDPLYTAMAGVVCRSMVIPFITAIDEADSQCWEHPVTGEIAGVVLTGDSDLLGYGHQKVVIIWSYYHEIYRITDLSDIGLAISLSD